MFKLSRLVLLMVLPAVLWLSCGDPDGSFTPVEQIRTPYSIAKTAWQKNGHDSYTLEQDVGFFAPAGFLGWVRLKIENNTIVEATYLNPDPPEYDLETHWYKTVDDLFALIESASRADSVIITYDSVYGYPDRIVIDWVFEVTDEQISYSTRLILSDD